MPAVLATQENNKQFSMKQLLFILIIIVLVASCRSTKNIQTAINKKDTVAVVTTPVVNAHEDSMAVIKQNYNMVLAHHINFNTFSAKIDVDYEDQDGKNYNVTAHVRMYKDSVIWISITAILGIEGLRAYITKDSVRLINKQDKTYSVRAVSYLQDVTALPLDLSSLQDLLLGNPVFLDSNVVSYSRTGNTISLLSNGELFKQLLTIDMNNKLPLSSKLDDIDEMRNRTCYLTYDDYEDKKGVNFSTRRSISVSEKKKLDIHLNYKQYDFNETLSFPFSIPKNYKRN
jgi:uncharacterized protein YcfL